MTHTPTVEEERGSYSRSSASQFAALAAGPIAVLAGMEAKYLLVPWSCRTGASWMLHVVSVAAIVIAALGMLAASRSWRSAGAEWPRDEATAAGRVRFLAAMGVLLGAMSILVIAAQWFPDFLISPCQR
jgi:hypothetical protein